jgi:hypothetical protein
VRRPAETVSEWNELVGDASADIIRSREQWNGVIAEVSASSASHPLFGCDKATVDQFTADLAFSDGALRGADYSQVQNKLTYTRFAALWARFGIGMRLFVERMGWCWDPERRVCFPCADRWCIH